MGGRRRRRTPEVAEAEIVSAAESLLRERSFRELTVDEVMRRTDLSRPSFYVYFRDRHHLILRVVEHLGNELRTMSQRWYTGSGDGPAQAREAGETSRALVWMMERYLNLSLGRAQGTPRDKVAETLTVIWTRVLYRT